MKEILERLIEDEFLVGFKYEEFEVRMYYIGTQYVGYKATLNDEIVACGLDYRPSPLFNIDDDESILSLLGFLLLTEDDIEDDFFKDRPNTKLMEWAKWKGEDLKVKLYDFEERENERVLQENEMTKEDCETILKYIYRD